MPQNGKTGGLLPETEAAVELERAEVVELGVHDGSHDAMAPQPVERVERQRPPDPVALVCGVDREALKVTVAAGTPADRVGAQRCATPELGHTEPNGWCGVERVLQAPPVESPELVERGAVDVERAFAIGSPPTPQRRPRRPRREIGEIVTQQMEAFMLVEPRGEKGSLLLRGEGGGDDRGETLTRQQLEAVPDEARRRCRCIGPGGEEGDRGVAAPRGGTRALASAFDDAGPTVFAEKPVLVASWAGGARPEQGRIGHSHPRITTAGGMEPARR